MYKGQRTGSRPRSRISLLERTGEAELVSSRINDVEVALAPLGVPRRGAGLQPVGDHVLVKGVNILHMEDHPAPELSLGTPCFGN